MGKATIHGLPDFITVEEGPEKTFCLCDSKGNILSSEDMTAICNGVSTFINKFGHDIDEFNEAHRLKQEKEIEAAMNQPKDREQGYVYLFECGKKYKVGFSKDISRRIKDLDHRPFKVKLVAKSKPTTNALFYEQRLHKILEEYRINGEWYNLTEKQVYNLKKIIEEEI